MYFLSRRQLELMNDFYNLFADCYRCANASEICHGTCYNKQNFKIHDDIKQEANNLVADYINKHQEDKDPYAMLRHIFGEEYECATCEYSLVCEEMDGDCEFVPNKTLISILMKVIENESYKIESERI